MQDIVFQSGENIDEDPLVIKSKDDISSRYSKHFELYFENIFALKAVLRIQWYLHFWAHECCCCFRRADFSLVWYVHRVI